MVGYTWQKENNGRPLGMSKKVESKKHKTLITVKIEYCRSGFLILICVLIEAIRDMKYFNYLTIPVSYKLSIIYNIFSIFIVL